MFETMDMGREAWLKYAETWLSRDEADQIFAQLMDELPWEQRPIYAFGKEIMQPRLMAWGGDLAYKYSGQTLDAMPPSPTLQALLERAAHDCQCPFNHVVANLYRDGQDNIASHADNEPELGRNPLIASLSLGAERAFTMTSKRNRKYKKQMALKHGSLLVMGGSFQHTWRHALPKRRGIIEPRINITFRQLMGPPGWRAWHAEKAEAMRRRAEKAAQLDANGMDE